MKIRSGFVSNSSSTSYIIVVKDSHVCSECGISNDKVVSAVIDLLDNQSYDVSSGEFGSHEKFSGAIQDYINSINNEISELEKDIDWAKMELKSLEKISKNSNAISLFSKWRLIKNCSEGSQYYSIRSARREDEAGERGEIEDAIKYVEMKIDDKLKEIESLIKERDLIVKNQNKKMYKFTVSNGDKLDYELKDWIRGGWVEVIKSKSI